MIDIHCHILPGVDDGAEDMAASVRMARMAADSGVEALIATPHCNLPYAQAKNYATGQLAAQFENLRAAVAAEGIPLALGLGSEVMATPDLQTLIRQNRLATLAGSRYLLVEFFFDEPLAYIEDRLACVAASGLIPVVAHPERYEAVQQAPYAAERWFARGYILQLNKGSILGRLGRRAETAAGWLLGRGLAHAVASDAHSPVVRTTHMEEVREYLEDTCGMQYADILLNVNPGRIIRDQPVLEA